VIELLLEAGHGPAIAATRTPDKLADLAERGVEVRLADFDKPGTLGDAFAGAGRLLLISTDTVDGTDRRRVQHRNAIDAAVRAGVSHLVYTSMIRPEPGSPIALAPDHYETEQALLATPLGWTVLRNNVYTDMFLQTLPRAVASGRLVAAAGDGGAAYVTREDCARAAAAALAQDTADRRTLDITGPEVVTHADLARILTELAGRPVAYLSVGTEAMIAGMVQAGLPEPVARSYVTFDVAIARGALAVVSTACSDLTGRPQQSVRDYLSEHRAALMG
jgi:NAD(P)H dehydrogenase (quinone)